MKKIKLIVLLMLCSAPMLVLGKKVTTVISAEVADLRDYVGTYKVSDLPFDKVIISERGGKLHYVAGEYEGDFMEVSGKADTYSANENATVTFLRNAGGQVDKIKLEIDGDVFMGTKEADAMASAAPAIGDYVGKYKMENLPFEYIVLTEKDSQLHIEAGDREGMLTAVASQKDTFDAGGQATIKFVRNDQMKVSKIVVEAQGQVFEGVPVAK